MESRDLIGGFDPEVRSGLSFRASIHARMFVELLDRGMRGALELLGGQFGEPSFDEVHP